MLIHDTAVLQERLSRQAAARALISGNPHPGPVALRMLRLLGAICHGPARLIAIALISALFLITVGEVALALQMSRWHAAFFDVLERKSLEGLSTQIWFFLAIIGGMMALQASSLESKMRLQMALRTHLTALVRDRWMDAGRHYRLRYMGGEHSNEDGRLSEDIRVSCEMVVEFAVSLLYAITQLVLFTGVLWFNSGTVTLSLAGVAINVPGHMVWIALLYAGAGAAITILIGHPLVRATDARQSAEAEYRARLVNSIAHASAIALAGAEAGERGRLAAAYQRILAAWTSQKKSFRNLLFFSAGYGQLTSVLPLLILAPRYFAGEMSLGTLVQIGIAFGQVASAMSWFSGNYSSIALWEASAGRVLGLEEAVEDVDRAFGRDVEGRFSRAPLNGPALSFQDLSLFTPGGECLIDRFSTDIRPGERVLVEATPQAAEALFRAVAGLSYLGAGRIELPDDSEPYFLGEYPYLPEITLLEALTEPHHREKLARDEIVRTLSDTGLSRLIPRLNQTADWEQELGMEDQQRLGFAIALLRRPRWILMHNAASALTGAAETALMDLLRRRLPDAAIIAIAHRHESEHGFERRIAIGGGAGG